MSVAERAGGGPANDTEIALRALRRRGFRFIGSREERDEAGEVIAVIGVRANGNVIDVVRLQGKGHAIATRMPCGDDIMAPAQVFWQREGRAQQVLGELLALPEDRLVAGGKRSRAGGGPNVCR